MNSEMERGNNEDARPLEQDSFVSALLHGNIAHQSGGAVSRLPQQETSPESKNRLPRKTTGRKHQSKRQSRARGHKRKALNR